MTTYNVTYKRKMIEPLRFITVNAKDEDDAIAKIEKKQGEILVISISERKDA